MAATEEGSPLTPQQQQYLDAAGALSPDKSLDRVDALAKFVFANVAVVGTLLAGLGLFTTGALTLRRGPHVFGLPLTIGLVAASLLASIGALFPTVSLVNPGDLQTVQHFFAREIPRRGIFAILSLTLFAGAIVSASAIAVLDAAPAQQAPAVSINLIGSGATAALLVNSEVDGLPDGSLMEVTATGHRTDVSRVLCRSTSLVGASGVATFSCRVPAGPFRSYTVTTVASHAARALESKTVSLTR